MQLWQYCLLVTAKLLYMFRTLSASIIRSTRYCSSSHWCMPWVGTHGIHQWLLLQLLELVRNLMAHGDAREGK